MAPQIEIHKQGQWTPAASILPLGNDRCRVEYLAEYLFSDDPVPISLGMPLAFAPDVIVTPDGGSLERVDRALPPFLFDLIPQGKGRDRKSVV